MENLFLMREPPLAEEEEDEECQPERIGGMARWKAETPATTAVDYVNHFRKGIIEIGRAQALYIRTYQRGAYLVGKSNGQRQPYHAEKRHLPMKIAQHHIPDGGIHRNPYPFATVCTHKVVKECTVHPDQ